MSIRDGHELGAVFMLMRELFDLVTCLELSGILERETCGSTLLEGRPRFD